MKSAKSSTEVTTDPLIVNNTGQDVDYRLSGGDGKNWPDWTQLPKDGQTRVAAPPQACTLEIRITLKQPIDRPLAKIEVTRNLQVKCRPQGEPTQPKAPTRKSRPTKPAGQRADRTKRPAGPSDSPRAAS